MACKNFIEIMFLTMSMFWQWQNKQHFFRADFKSTGHFFEMAFKHCHSRLCSFVSLLIWYVLLATEKRPRGLSNDDEDFRAAWHWPSLKGWWWWGAASQRSTLILQDLSGNTLRCKNKWQLADSEEFYFFEESYFAIFSSRGVQNSVDMGSETHSCAVGPV